MTREQIVVLLERIEELPPEAQDEVMHSIEEIGARYGATYRLTDEDRAALARSEADVRNGRFASDEEVSKVFRRYRT